MKSTQKENKRLKKLTDFTKEEWDSSSIIDAQPKNLQKIAEWATDKFVKYKLINNSIVVHIIRKSPGYKDMKKTLYKLQKAYL